MLITPEKICFEKLYCAVRSYKEIVLLQSSHYPLVLLHRTINNGDFVDLTANY